jgi:hypothetical protein
LEQLRILNSGRLEGGTVNFRQLEEEFPVDILLMADRRLLGHIDSFAAGIGFILGGAGFHTESAAGAVFRRDLDGEFVAGEFFEFGID